MHGVAAIATLCPAVLAHAAANSTALHIQESLTAPLTLMASQPTPSDDAAALLEDASVVEQLQVVASSYLWLTSFDGSIASQGLEFDLDLDFRDVLDESDSLFGFTGAIDASYKRLVFQFNGMVTNVEVSGQQTVFENVAIDGDLELQTAWIEGFGGYRFVDVQLGSADDPARLVVDGFAGLRFTVLETKVDATASASVTLPPGIVLEPGVTTAVDQTEAWLEPFLGGRVGLDLNNRWSFSLRADVGGFGIDDPEFSWQAQALIGYRWPLEGWDFGIYGGFRALGQDYEGGDFAWDVITYGPVLGIAAVIRF